MKNDPHTKPPVVLELVAGRTIAVRFYYQPSIRTRVATPLRRQPPETREAVPCVRLLSFPDYPLRHPSPSSPDLAFCSRSSSFPTPSGHSGAIKSGTAIVPRRAVPPELSGAGHRMSPRLTPGEMLTSGSAYSTISGGTGSRHDNATTGDRKGTTMRLNWLRLGRKTRKLRNRTRLALCIGLRANPPRIATHDVNRHSNESVSPLSAYLVT